MTKDTIIRMAGFARAFSLDVILYSFKYASCSRSRPENHCKKLREMFGVVNKFSGSVELQEWRIAFEITTLSTESGTL